MKRMYYIHDCATGKWYDQTAVSAVSAGKQFIDTVLREKKTLKRVKTEPDIIIALKKDYNGQYFAIQ